MAYINTIFSVTSAPPWTSHIRVELCTADAVSLTHYHQQSVFALRFMLVFCGLWQMYGMCPPLEHCAESFHWWADTGTVGWGIAWNTSIPYWSASLSPKCSAADSALDECTWKSSGNKCLGPATCIGNQDEVPGSGLHPGPSFAGIWGDEQAYRRPLSLSLLSLSHISIDLKNKYMNLKKE